MEPEITILTGFVDVYQSVDALTLFLAMAYREISPRPGIILSESVRIIHMRSFSMRHTRVQVG